MKRLVLVSVVLGLPSIALAFDPYTEGTIPPCTRASYEGALRAYSSLLDDASKKKLAVALGSLDAWYNINAKGSGLKMTERETMEFMAKAVCGRSGYQVEQIAAKMMGTK
jgi:hypothetical protein